MSKPLDELREVLLDCAAEGQLTEREARAILDTFEAEHPLLHECEDPIECHKCKGQFPSCSWTEDWGEKEVMLCNSDGEIDDHEFVPVCPACAAKTEGELP